MAAGRVGAVIVAVLGTSGFACAHLGSRPEKPTMAAGKYAVESIRSRAQLDGIDQVIEISEQGTKLVDSNGAEHVLTERGALLLSEDGACRLALAVSVDGEEPGVSDRACTWQLQGDQFLLGDASGTGTRTVYQVKRAAGRLVLEGISDVDAKGNIVGDAKGERIVLVERPAEYANRSVDRTSEEQAAREIQEYLHDL
ncbi:MAG: hypothetical protein E6J88_01800 [Deltaproteobacteria bacterium]|nr:MAG: hypothetical protein E6J88_01800 [Deltaproteobacteria bacterium]